RAGREIYAIGSNAEAARLAGIGLRRRVVAAYVVSGALAGLAGALYVARFGYVDATTGPGYELTGVSAVGVGGGALTGGGRPRVRRGARRAAAHLDQQRAARAERELGLGGGDRRVPAAARHRRRPARRPAGGRGTEGEEPATCLT